MPAAKEQIRRIILENNINSVADEVVGDDDVGDNPARVKPDILVNFLGRTAPENLRP